MIKNFFYYLIIFLSFTVYFAENLDSKEIHLKSRKFVPEEFSDPGKINRFEEIRRGVKRVHALIQMYHIPDKKERMALENAGITLLDYIPHNSWLVVISAETVVSRDIRATVRWIDLLTPEDKISPDIREHGVGKWARRSDGQVVLRVNYFSDVTLDETKTAMESLGVMIVRETPEFHTIDIVAEERKINKIAMEDIVQWIEEIPPPPVLHNNGTRLNTLAGVVQAAPYNLTGANVDAGQWDDGVDSTHADFGTPSRVTEVSNVGIKGIHATHVAGTMGGDGISSNGLYKGIAPGIDIFSYNFSGPRVTDHDGAINTNGIEISNNSWGDAVMIPNCSHYGNYESDAPAFDEIVTGKYGKKITVVFSAGDERISTRWSPPECSGTQQNPYYPYNTITPPATAKNVITVGAINSNDSTIADFSSWGPVDDGRIKPEVAAPGCESGGDNGITSTSTPPNNYAVYCGTSMAAPAVSGGAALIIEEYRNRNNENDPLPSTVKALLVHGAQDIGNTGPDYSSGYGKIDLQRSIDTLISGGLIEGEIDNQESDIFYLVVPDGATSIKVTLAWDDEKAAPLAALTLKNDIDLILKDPDGNRYYPWTLDPLNPSAFAVRMQEDHTNNLEQIEVTGTLAPGAWTIEVFGAVIPVNYMPKYSLIFTPSSFLGVSVIPNSVERYSLDIPKNIIPSGSGSTGVTSTLLFPDDLMISRINVYAAINRTACPCIYKITLTSPGNTPVVLYDGVAGTPTFQTWFDKNTPTKESLKSLVGESAGGTWLLNVIDLFTGNNAVLSNWGIEVLTNSWAIGNTLSGSTKTMSASERFPVQNIGNVAATFSLHISDPGTPWSAASTANGNGKDTYVMNGIFSALIDNTISELDFNTGSDDDVILSSSQKIATATDFASSDVTTLNGVGVPAGETRSLWLQFKAPTESSVTTSQHLLITVGTMPP